jgi:zinc transport system permease protein
MGVLDDFVVRAALAGIGLAFAAGPLGCFVVWRRMAYFGDATAHAALLGVALALAADLPILPGVTLAAVAMALVVSGGLGRLHAMDTLLGVAAHAALACGLVALSFLPGVRVDLMAYLFGDVLSVTVTDLAVIWGGAAVVGALIAWRWRGLLVATLSADMAAAEGGNPERARLVLVVALALLVAVALKVVGALLITAMLIIPAAAARPLSATPEAMAALAVGLGVLSVLGGLGASMSQDTPAGPSIVVAALVIFALTHIAAAAFRHRPGGSA